MPTNSGIRLFLCASLVLSIATGAALAQGQKITPDTSPANAEERDNPQARAQWFMRGRMVNGKPAPQLLDKAYQQKMASRRLREQARQARARTASTQTSATANAVLSTGPSWTPLGPAPSGTASPGDDQDYGPAIGRTTVVVVDQSDQTGNTVYIGGAAGGLWKSTNAADSTVLNCSSVSASNAPSCAPGVTWTPLIDQQATLTVGAMAIKPDNNQWLVVGTGEANNSVDSYYGLGFLVSQDGGSNWTAVNSALSADGSTTIDLHGEGTTAIAFSTDNPSLVVATMAAASGGISVGAEFAGDSARGIYFSTDAGLHWQHATISDPRGTLQNASANTVIYNASEHAFYADLRWHGVYKSTDGQHWTLLGTQPGGTTLNIYNNCPTTVVAGGGSCPIYRSVLAQVPGRDEMYIWMVDANDVDKGIYGTKDGGNSWTPLSMTGIDTCGDGSKGSCGTTQGTYNLTLAAVPNGTNGSTATDLYAGAVNEYRCSIDPASNPTCATKPFYNLTHTYYDCGSGGGVGGFANVHPDQHGIDFVQGKPAIIYFGNDGGVYRTLNGFDTTTKTCNGTSQPWIQFDNLSGTMGSMIQYVWFSQNPSDNTVLLGGTQDNGSMAKNSSSPTTSYGYSWQSVNNGDGGFNDINPTNPLEWFTSSPQSSGNVDVEQCTAGMSCTAGGFSQIVHQSDLGGDNAPFYMPYMLDPQAANHLLVGTCRLWRVDRGSTATSWPTFTQLSYNLDSFASAGTSACSQSALNQVSIMAAGGPCKGVCNAGTNGTGNGSQVLYLGTVTGRLFVTTNADGGPTTWVERSSGLNNTNNTGGCGGVTPCGYPISGIAVDPADATGNTAYVTVMGFKTGHVYKTTNAGANWTLLDGTAGGTGLPDNPADAVAVDPNTSGLVYVATDVGVFKSIGDGNWTEVGPSSGTGALPNVATTALHVFGTGANTRLRVSTYGRGIWEIPIPNTPSFELTVAPLTATVDVNLQTFTFNASIIPYNGYNSPVNLQCNAPAGVTCTVSTAQVSTSSGTATFTIAAAGSTVGDYALNVVATGTDSAVVTQQQALTLHVILPQGITISTPAQTSAPAGSTATTSFNLTATNGFSGNVTLACAGLPAGAGPCAFAPAIPNLPAGGTVNVSLSIPTGSTPASSTPYQYTVTASSPNSQTATATGSFHVSDFSVAGPSAAVTFTPTLPVEFKVTISSTTSFIGTVNLSCPTVPASMAGGCTFTDPVTLQTITSVDLSAATQSVTVNVSIPTNTSSASGTVVVQATGSGLSHSANVALQVSSDPNALQVTNSSPVTPIVVKTGQQLSAGVTVRSSYSANVNMTCAIAPANLVGTSTCAVSPATFAIAQGGSTAVGVSVNSFGGLPGNATVTVTATDSANSAKTSSGDPFAYTVTDYSVTAGAATPILPGGTTTANLSLTPLSGYTGTVNASCVVQGTPLTCVLTPVGPYTVSGSAAVPVAATITGPGSTNTTASGNYTVTIQTSDAGFATLAHNTTIPITVQDYKLTTTDTTGAAKTAATVTAGQSASFAVNVVAQAGGFSGNVVLDAATVCGGLPSKASCTLNGQSTGQVTLTSGGTATLAIQTTAATTAMARPQSRPDAPLFAFWTMLPGAAGIVVMGRRRKRNAWALLAVVVVLLIGMTACGGGGGSTTPPPPIPVPGTPAGQYTITLTSTAGAGATAMTRTTQVTLTVQ